MGTTSNHFRCGFFFTSAHLQVSNYLNLVLLVIARPPEVLTVMISKLREWVGPILSAFLLWMVVKMLQVRRKRIPQKQNKIVIRAGSDQSTMESIVTAQQGLRSVHEMMKETNITLLKMWSILISEAPKVTFKIKSP